METIIKLRLKRAIINSDTTRLVDGRMLVNNINNLSNIILDDYGELFNYECIKYILYKFYKRGYRKTYIEKNKLNDLIDCVCRELGTTRDQLIQEIEI